MASYNSNKIKYNDSSLIRQAAVSTSSDKPVVLDTTSTTDSINLKFQLVSGDTRSITLNSPKADISDTDVNDAMDGMVTYGSIFEDGLKAKEEASAKVTTKTQYDLT